MKFINMTCRFACWFAMVTIVAMMLLTVADVFLRFTVSSPIRGTKELTELMMVWIMMTLGLVTLEGMNVKIDLIMMRFPPKVQIFAEIIAHILSSGIFMVMVWQIIVAMRYSINYNVHTTLLKIPESLTLGFYGLSYAVFLLAVLALLTKRIAEVLKK